MRLSSTPPQASILATPRVSILTNGGRLGLEDHSGFFSSINFDADRTGETNMTDKLCFMKRLLLVEECFIKKAVVIQKGMNGEISHAKRGKVLEKMGSLARFDPIIIHAGLCNYTCLADVRPLDGYSQPGVGRSPSARPHQHVVRV